MYIVHGTLAENVLPILKEGKLTVSSRHKKTVGLGHEPPSNQIFTQLIYHGIPYEKDQAPHWFYACFVFDSVLLMKNKPFYATDTGAYYPSFNKGLSEKSTKWIWARGKGKHSTKLPSLTRLRKYIDTAQERKPWLKNSAFLHSHEVMWGTDISLRKYCKALVVYPSFKHLRTAETLADKMGIPVVVIHKKGFGLNTFLDVVKEKVENL